MLQSEKVQAEKVQAARNAYIKFRKEANEQGFCSVLVDDSCLPGNESLCYERLKQFRDNTRQQLEQVRIRLESGTEWGGNQAAEEAHCGTLEIHLEKWEEACRRAEAGENARSVLREILEYLPVLARNKTLPVNQLYQAFRDPATREQACFTASGYAFLVCRLQGKLRKALHILGKGQNPLDIFKEWLPSAITLAEVSNSSFRELMRLPGKAEWQVIKQGTKKLRENVSQEANKQISFISLSDLENTPEYAAFEIGFRNIESSIFLEEIFATMNITERQTFVMLDQGYTHKEIADFRGETPDAVKKRVTRWRKQNASLLD